MTLFVTVNGRSYIRESLTLMRPHIAGKFVAEFLGGFGGPTPSCARHHPVLEVGATAPGAPGETSGSSPIPGAPRSTL